MESLLGFVDFGLLRAKHRPMKFLVAVLTTSFVLNAHADDWPQWRGLHRNSISSERVGVVWPAAGPKVLWRASVGTGFSSFSISNGRVYTMGNANEKDTIWCFDALTGKQIWRHSYEAKLGPQYYEGGPASTPTVDGG